MERNTKKEILKFYLKERRRGLLLFLACTVLFLALFYLEHLPLDAVLYGCALCGTVCLLAGLWDLTGYIRRHQVLMSLLRQPLAETEALPEPSCLLEREYQMFLKAEYEARKRAEGDRRRNRQEMLDYYTLWAHQIKTPIAAMRLLLVNDTDHDRAVAAELFRVEEYVGMVLSYLRLDGDTTDFVIRRCSLEKLVRQAVRKYAPFFIRKKIRLTFSSMEADVLTDEKWLSFVIEQILSNALKYTSEGEIAIYLEAPKTLVIADTGIGIESSDLPRICERGFTGYNGRTDQAATGIGLYLCREILTKLSHTLTITSEPGVGTQVRIGLDTVTYRME